MAFTSFIVRTLVRGGMASAVLSAALVAGAVTVAQAETKTRTTHDDWTVRCEEKGVCEAVQTLQTEDLKGILAHVAVRPEADGVIRAIVQVPRGVWLPANVILRAAGAPDVTLTYKRCGSYCVASVELKGEELAALSGKPGADLVFENGSRQPITLSVSFKGLKVAVENAAKR